MFQKIKVWGVELRRGRILLLGENIEQKSLQVDSLKIVSLFMDELLAGRFPTAFPEY